MSISENYSREQIGTERAFRAKKINKIIRRNETQQRLARECKEIEVYKNFIKGK